MGVSASVEMCGGEVAAADVMEALDYNYEYQTLNRFTFTTGNEPFWLQIEVSKGSGYDVEC